MLNRRRGFTLVELMIGLALLGLLLMLAMPSFSAMLQNSKLRQTAESIMLGLQSARTEAIKLNQTVEFVMTTDTPTAADVASYAKSTAGRNWAIRAVDGGTYTFIEAETANESNGGVTVAASGGGFDGIVTFTNWGITTLSADVAIDVENPTGGACKTTGGDEPMRCLRIVVTTSGRLRMCDPSIVSTTDTRAC